jgi:hypothetical protein
MARRDDVAAALELMQGGLIFSSYLGDDHGSPRTCWYWDYNEVHRDGFACELDAVEDFCRWFSSLKSAGTVFVADLKPGPFDLDAFMMDGIQALTLAAAEEMRARGQELDAETVAGVLARAWHDSYPARDEDRGQDRED